MSDILERCGSCRFFLHSTEDESVRQTTDPMPQGHRIGWCRRNAPKPLGGGSGTGWSDWEWPAVRYEDWCGEFETRYAALTGEHDRKGGSE